MRRCFRFHDFQDDLIKGDFARIQNPQHNIFANESYQMNLRFTD